MSTSQFSVNNILFKCKVHQDKTIQYNTFDKDTEKSVWLV